MEQDIIIKNALGNLSKPAEIWCQENTKGKFYKEAGLIKMRQLRNEALSTLPQNERADYLKHSDEHEFRMLSERNKAEALNSAINGLTFVGVAGIAGILAYILNKQKK